MKHLFLLLVLLLGTCAAGAQAPGLAARPDSLAAPLATAPAAPDTVAAIHRLFAARRKKNGRIFIGTLGITTLGGVVIGTASSSWDGLAQAALGVLIIGVISVPALTAEAIIALKYTREREQQAVAAFEAHRLPGYLRRQLRAKHFQ